MRHAARLTLAVAVWLLAAGGTRAQQLSPTNVFTFAPAPSDLTEVPDADDITTKLKARAELKVRPNAGTELYLWVLNPTPNKDRFVVEVKGAGGALAVRTAEVTIPANTWVRVRVPKPAAPAAPPVAPVVVVPPPGAAPPQPAPPPEPPPPPGMLLAPVKGERKLSLRLLDKAGDPVKDADGRVYGKDYPVTVLDPSDYVKTPIGTVTPGKGVIGVKMVVAQEPKFTYPGSATVQLLFPPQEALKGAFLRDGFYRRTLTFDPDQPQRAAVTLTGTVEGAREKARAYVGVDGIDRAFRYTLNPLGKTPATQLLPYRTPEVRVSRVLLPPVTRPVGKYPVLVEVDNAAAGDKLELRLTPLGGSKDLTETIKFDEQRDVGVWLDTAGPTDGGLFFTTRSRDWVRPLDLSHLQGKVEVVGVLETADRFVYSEPLVLTVDATPPERVVFLPIEATLVKGKPLVVAAAVNDPDTAVVKATFFLFRQFDDGKIPADAIKGAGIQSAKNPAVWATELKVPDELRGPALVAVVFANEVGLVNDPPVVQRVEIVDAKPGLGTIEGKVTFGDRLQPGVQVSLRGDDGKEKAATVTDDKGRFKFVRVPPGNYRLVALKKDSSTGATGSAPVLSEPDKTTNITLTLEKIRQ